MDEFVSMGGQEMSEVLEKKIENTADNVVKSIKELFEEPRVTDGDVNAYINTYFSLGYILNVGKEYLFQCLNDKMESAGLYLKKSKDFDESGEKPVLNGWEICVSGKYLEGLFKGYFSLIDKMKLITKIEDLDDYKNQFSKILGFSKSPVMENNIWEGDESCGAYLRNLLSPFKTLIDFFEDTSRWGDNFEDVRNKLIPSWEENKHMIDDFCKFLNDKNLFMTFN